MKSNSRILGAIKAKQFGIKHKRPTKPEQEQILRRQRYRCFYCGLKLNEIGEDGLLKNKLNWDHVLPFSYSYNNDSQNQVAACAACNQVKQDKVFDTIQQAIDYVREQRGTKHWSVCELWETLPKKAQVAEVLHGAMSEQFFLEVSQDCSNLSTERLKERVEFLKKFNSVF